MKSKRARHKGKSRNSSSVRVSGHWWSRKPKQNAYKPYRMRIPQVLWLVHLAMFLGFGGVIGYFAGEEILT
jgi:hypothetical protein